MKAYLLVNFGGPRDLKEIAPFLNSLLNDEEVIWPIMPKFLHHLFFSYIAKKRAKTIVHDYEKIGNKSPIYEETEALAKILEKKMGIPIITFHRYLKETHAKTLKLLNSPEFTEIHVFPMFPQFSYATTGSGARFFFENLPRETLNKLKWIKSYPTEMPFVDLWQKILRRFLKNHSLLDKECFFIFSAHGLPKKFISGGDPYEMECQLTVNKVMKGFDVPFKLAYQSQFGRDQWIGPATLELSRDILNYHQGRKNILFIPISFTSDHIETLFEIEETYMPIIRDKGLNVFRVKAPYSHEDFPDSIAKMLNDFVPFHTSMLVRKC